MHKSACNSICNVFQSGVDNISYHYQFLIHKSIHLREINLYYYYYYIAGFWTFEHSDGKIARRTFLRDLRTFGQLFSVSEITKLSPLYNQITL